MIFFVSLQTKKQPKKMNTTLTPAQSFEVQTTTTNAASALVGRFLSESTANERTVELYRKSLKYFLSWTEENVAGIAIERADVVRYQKELTDERKLSPNTVAAYMLAVKNFFAWLEANRIGTDVSKGIKPPKVEKEEIVRHLTTERSRLLLDYFAARSKRDFAIVNLCLRTGLRSVEVVRADVGDIKFINEKRVLYVQGKGRKTKSDFVILTDAAFDPIREYLSTRPNRKEGEPLFTSDAHRNAGERLTTRSIRRICKEGLIATGFDERGYSAHVLRHTTAATMLLNGATAEDIQFTLRHQSANTTKRYFESAIAEERLRRCPESILDRAFN